ncbi:MAG: 4Fe-4S dicluster domain-containing protein [Armatimonadetes bacterium]|nr:4Fe-4S dicluster domain-containing protein [Armatimonadota bacterium]
MAIKDLLEKVCVPDRPRFPVGKEDHETRKTDYREVEKGYTQEEAMREANRCLACGVKICVACGYCAAVCPTGVIAITAIEKANGKRYVEKFEIDHTKCMFCGLCVELCPTGCLVFTDEFEMSVYDRKAATVDQRQYSGPAALPKELPNPVLPSPISKGVSEVWTR